MALATLREIEEKRAALYALAPFSDGVKALRRRLDLLDFAFSDLRLYGSRLTQGGVERVLSGEMVAGIPVFEHRLCEAHRKLLARFSDRLEMGLEVDRAVLGEFASVLAGGSPPHREGSPLLYHLDFVPGDAGQIPADLDDVFREARRAGREGGAGGMGGDFCLRAAALHMGIVRVYPYKDGFSELAARAAMQYELTRAGYFPVDIGVSEQEYGRVTATAVKGGGLEGFAGLVRGAVLAKLGVLAEAAGRGV